MVCYVKYKLQLSSFCKQVNIHWNIYFVNSHFDFDFKDT